MRQQLGKALLYISGLCTLVMPTLAHANWPKNSRVPGGVAIVELNVTCNEPPVVKYLGNRVLVVANQKQSKHWVAVVGIPLDANVGLQKLEILHNHTNTTQEFVIQDKKYKTEHLTIADKTKVEPPAEILQKIETEYLETIKTYAYWQDQVIHSLKLPIPVKGRKSSPFGLTRIMNNIPKNPHSGLDIAAPIGTKVFCPKDGTVINIGNFFYSGNIVFIDHGQGFITSYCHLNSVTVKRGQSIRKGTVIGTVGKTGRATGPHLHWSVSLNGVRVDPELFIAPRS